MFCITHIEECNNNAKEMNCVPHPKIVFTPFNLYLTFLQQVNKLEGKINFFP